MDLFKLQKFEWFVNMLDPSLYELLVLFRLSQ